jgi:hypothetical protein
MLYFLGKYVLYASLELLSAVVVLYFHLLNSVTSEICKK